METIELQLQLLKALFQSMPHQDIQNPVHPAWGLYDNLQTLQ